MDSSVGLLSSSSSIQYKLNYTVDQSMDITMTSSTISTPVLYSSNNNNNNRENNSNDNSNGNSCIKRGITTGNINSSNKTCCIDNNTCGNGLSDNSCKDDTVIMQNSDNVENRINSTSIGCSINCSIASNGCSNGDCISNGNSCCTTTLSCGMPVVLDNGQKKIGPPADWTGPLPGRGCEIFVGKVPRDCEEAELLPILGKVGRVYELRIMVDFTGTGRGYCFASYGRKEEAKQAVKELNNYEIRKGRYLGVCSSVDNCRLFVGGLPRHKTQRDVDLALRQIADDIVDVIVYCDARDKTKNRGFAFLEFPNHRSAAMARRTLLAAGVQPWGQPLAIDWAEPELDVDEEIMSKVKILYVRNLMMDTEEETLERLFSDTLGKQAAIERVKKIRDYAFVHFKEREDALTIMQKLNGADVEGSRIEIVLAKPADKANNPRQKSSSSSAEATAATATLQAAAAVGQVVPVAGFPYAYAAVAAAAVAGGSVAAANNTLLSAAGQGNISNMATSHFLQSSVTREVLPGVRNPLVMGSREACSKVGRLRGAGGIARVYPQARFPYKKAHLDLRQFAPCILPAGVEVVINNQTLVTANSTVNNNTYHQLQQQQQQQMMPARSAVQILEEVCLINGWAAPSYQLFTTSLTPDIQPLFLAKVAIPGVVVGGATGRLCISLDEAKVSAAHMTLSQLGYVTVEGSSIACPALPAPTIPPNLAHSLASTSSQPYACQDMPLMVPQGSLILPQVALPQGSQCSSLGPTETLPHMGLTTMMGTAGQPYILQGKMSGLTAGQQMYNAPTLNGIPLTHIFHYPQEVRFSTSADLN